MAEKPSNAAFLIALEEDHIEIEANEAIVIKIIELIITGILKDKLCIFSF